MIRSLLRKKDTIYYSVFGQLRSDGRYRLINNAVKYNKQKGNLNIHSYLVDQDYIIEVSDTGRGISLIDQGRVFERFFRCDAGRDKETGGTGLGLAIVKHIVQYYKGTIHLESELGKGTTFKVVLPIIKDSL